MEIVDIISKKETFSNMNLNISTQEDFTTTFAKSNSMTHPVEKEWHYPLFTKHNWIPETKVAEGFVRNYTYVNPKLNRKIIFTIGCNCDYFSEGSSVFLWSELEKYLAN